MDLNAFLHSRQTRWQRLANLLDRIEKAGVASLPPDEVDEFFRLYRLTSSDLNLVQTRTGNPAVVEYLEGLVARAYGTLSVPRKAHFFKAWWMILRHYFPAAIRREVRLLGIAAAMMCLGIIFGYAATSVSDESAELFLPPEHLVQRPAERVRILEEIERGGNPRISSLGQNSAYSTYLFTHNIRVSVLAFALGLTFGIGTTIVLFFNGAMVGSLACLYVRDGVFAFFVAWVGPHGSIELPCVLFAGTAGYMLTRTQLRHDRDPWIVRIRKVRPALLDLLIGCASLLVIAGTIEGGFSQINEPTLPYVLKSAVAAFLFIALLIYLFRMPAKPRPAEDSQESA